MAYEVLPIRTAFSLRSLWRGATKFQVTPVKVLQRTNDFSILEVADSAGARLKIKATRQFVPLFHTAHSSVNFAWKECGRLRFGCQVPTETLTEDLFLLRDQSNIARSACDPHYRPLPEFFEPWAQQWASSEQSTDDLPEPWMEGKFDFSDGQGTHGNRASNPDHLPAQGHQSELPSADGRSDSKASPKLRAGDSVLRAPILPADTIDTTSCSAQQTPTCADEHAFEYQDHDEPWAHCQGNIRQGFHFDQLSHPDHHLPEWFGSRQTTSSTLTGNDYHSLPTRPCAVSKDELFLQSNSRVLSTCYACVSGVYRLLSKGANVRTLRSYPNNRESPLVSTSSSCLRDEIHTCIPYSVDGNPDQGDFVKAYWIQTSTGTHMKKVDFVDVLDLRQFCHRNQIRYGWEPRFGKQSHSYQQSGRKEPSKLTLMIHLISPVNKNSLVS